MIKSTIALEEYVTSHNKWRRICYDPVAKLFLMSESQFALMDYGICWTIDSKAHSFSKLGDPTNHHPTWEESEAFHRYTWAKNVVEISVFPIMQVTVWLSTSRCLNLLNLINLLNLLLNRLKTSKSVSWLKYNTDEREILILLFTMNINPEDKD